MEKPSTSLELREITVLDPRLYGAIEQLSKNALSYSDNNSAVRHSINNLCHELRRLAKGRFGHDSPEVVSLIKLLRRAGGGEEPGRLTRTDPLTNLETLRHLSTKQTSAAHVIRAVWEAFGRGLVVTSRGIGKGGSGQRGRPVGPIEIMGASTLNAWSRYYTPWYEKARYRRVGNVTHVKVVLDIIVELYQPYELDKAFKLPVGTAFKTLLYELEMFYKRGSADPCDINPELLEEEEVA